MASTQPCQVSLERCDSITSPDRKIMNIENDPMDGESELYCGAEMRDNERDEPCRNSATDVLLAEVTEMAGDGPQSVDPTDQEDITCEFCDIRFDDCQLYKEHIKTHIHKDNKCDLCNEKFTTATKLKSHYYSEHGTTLPSQIEDNTAKTKPSRKRKTQAKIFTCDVCGKTFKKERSYEQHLHKHEKHEDMGNVICNICWKSFKSVKLRDEHMTEHDCALDCMTCGKSFTLEGKEKYQSHLKTHHKIHTSDELGNESGSSGELQEHDVAHTGSKPKTVECNYCDKSFLNKELYRRHLAVHGVGHELFKCEVCGKDVYSRMRLREHLASHKPKMVACTVCGKHFRSNYDAAVHERKHTGEKPYCCDLCGKAFSTSGAFKKHKDMHEGKMITCVLCKKEFVQKGILSNHLKAHAGELNSLSPTLDGASTDAETDDKKGVLYLVSDCTIEETKYECPLCNIFFQSETGLKAHYLKHVAVLVQAKAKGQRLHTCHICGKFYKSKHSLERHMHNHTDEKPYVCTECGEGLRTPLKLKTHMAKVHNVKYKPAPVDCQICGKTFQWPGNLKEHLKTHTDQRPFQCTFCGKQFRQKPHLDTHMRIHTGERPFQCSHCGNCFAAQSTLRNHIRNIHLRSNE